MALTILTTQELTDQALANLEAKLNQTAPLNEKAFLRVLAAVQALSDTGLYKFAAERAKQTLALTATGADLDLIGEEFEVIRKPSASAVLTATLPGIESTIIPTTASFVGAPNKVTYFMSASVAVVGGVATLSLTAEAPGVDGNLQIGDTLTIAAQVAGAEQTATVTAVTDTGAEEELDDAYRARILFAERATTGGSNATDHKIWAEEAAGVNRAFPYAGKPPELELTSYPGDRTVYVEADTTIDPDGIAPQSLLDDARDTINTDPETGLSRPALGLTDSTLYVQSIFRTPIAVEIKNLQTPSGGIAEVKAEVDAALTAYFFSIAMFVEGVDLAQDRNDLITEVSISRIVQEVLEGRESTATSVRFKLDYTPFITSYRLEPGELTKLAGTDYVA